MPRSPFIYRSHPSAAYARQTYGSFFMPILHDIIQPRGSRNYVAKYCIDHPRSYRCMITLVRRASSHSESKTLIEHLLFASYPHQPSLLWLISSTTTQSYPTVCVNSLSVLITFMKMTKRMTTSYALSSRVNTSTTKDIRSRSLSILFRMSLNLTMRF